MTPLESSRGIGDVVPTPRTRSRRPRLIQYLLQYRRAVVAVVFLVGVLLTAGAFLDKWRSTRLEVHTVFATEAWEHFRTLREEIEEALNRAASVADLFQTFGSVDRRQFREFVVPHLTRGPGLLALLWAPWVSDRSRGRFEAAGRREWGADFHVYEQETAGRRAGRRAEYFPILYQEPRTDSYNTPVMGQDVGAMPAHLEAIQRARDSGRPAMTAIVRLLTGERGVYIYWAIYQQRAPRTSVEERREYLQGVVGAVLRIDELIDYSLGSLIQRGIEVEILDERGSDPVLYSTPSSLKDPPRPWLGQRLAEDQIRADLRWTETLGVGGRRWSVVLSPTAGYVSSRVSSDMWETLLLGLLTTGFVGGFLFLLMRRTDEVERQVAARTQELEQAFTELTRAEDAARLHAAQLEAVHTVSQEVIREMNLNEVLKLVARQAGSLLPTGTSTVWLWDEAEQALVPRAWHGTGEWRRTARLRLGEGVVGTVAERRQSLVVNDYRTSVYALPFFLERTRTTAVVAQPLVYRDRLLGVLGLNNEATGRPFTDKDRNILALFAPQAAIAIHTAQLFDQVAAGREQARRLTQQVLTVQEEERRHLSRELHDDAGQALTTLALNLGLLGADASEDQPSLRQRILEAGASARAVADRIRLLARGLRPPGLDTLGLNTSLKGLCHEIVRRTGVSITYSGSEVSLLPDAVTVCLYRVLQEALTNVVKHAHAHLVRVELRQDAEGVSLSVEDDGRGFDPYDRRSAGNEEGSRGLGLLGMQERLELVDGRLEIVSRPGKGSRLVARVPTRDAASALAEIAPPRRGLKLPVTNPAESQDALRQPSPSDGHPGPRPHDGDGRRAARRNRGAVRRPDG